MLRVSVMDAGLIGGLNNDLGQAVEDRALAGFVRFMGTGIAVADANNRAAA